MKTVKPFEISKAVVWQAYSQVKANQGAAGVDKESIEEFERKLKDNLYQLWNRMSSGTYFPPPVKGVPIPKKTGGERLLGVPTVKDRIAQGVVKLALEPLLEPIFDENSFGYRPNRSAHDAIAITRQRCWKYDWVVEFDIQGLFDNIKHELLLKALRRHCKCKWILLYVERWLKVPLQHKDSSLSVRERGTPQGGVVSPILANLFLHYAFDAWVRKEMPLIPFCRYADDGLLHCKTQRQAKYVLKRIEQRFQECRLAINTKKSGIIYCKDKNRPETHQKISFDFLGFTFKPRRCVNGKGLVHPNFLPGISKVSKKAMVRTIRSWHLQIKSDKTLSDLSKMFNPILVGWSNYYGRFYTSAMNVIWRHINKYLARWIQRKYKKFAGHNRKAFGYLNLQAHANPYMFVHWKRGIFPGRKLVGAG